MPWMNFMRPVSQELDEEDRVKATNQRQLDLARYRGPGWAELANQANGQFWDYAGRAAPAAAGAAAQMATEPWVQALRNAGAKDVTGMEQAGAGDRARVAATTALKQTGMEQAGATGRTKIAGEYGLQQTGAEQAGATGRTQMQIGSAERIAELEAKAAMQRLTAQEAAELRNLQAQSAAAMLLQRERNKGELEVAKVPRYYSPGVLGGMVGGVGTPAIGGQIPPAPTPSAQNPPAKTATLAQVQAYAKDNGVSLAEAQADFLAAGYTVR